MIIRITKACCLLILFATILTDLNACSEDRNSSSSESTSSTVSIATELKLEKISPSQISARAESIRHSDSIEYESGSDTTGIKVNHDVLIVYAYINKNETSYFKNIQVTCSWRDKIIHNRTNKTAWGPGQAAKIEMLPKYSFDKKESLYRGTEFEDGTPIDPTLIHLDVDAKNGESKTSIDPDIPKCIVESAERVSIKEIQTNYATDDGMPNQKYFRKMSLLEQQYQRAIQSTRWDIACNTEIEIVMLAKGEGKNFGGGSHAQYYDMQAKNDCPKAGIYYP